ncbi:MAG: hypothetical protein M3Q10_11670 [Chloroflexota bacterium]|nr:hypothetical protein [Chloroflexota bacterium]
MSDRDGRIGEVQATRIGKNIDLAFRFLDEVLDDPARLAEIPDGSTLAILPPDDPELAAENTDKAIRLDRAGKNVRLYALGRPPGERSVWAYRTVTPRWPTKGIDPVAQYDARSDILVVDFFNGRRQGVDLPTREFGTLFVDRDTEEVVAHVLPYFLSRAVRKDPGIIDVLLRPETTLHGITRQEVADIRHVLTGETLPVEAAPASFAVITERLELLTAWPGHLPALRPMGTEGAR